MIDALGQAAGDSWTQGVHVVHGGLAKLEAHPKAAPPNPHTWYHRLELSTPVGSVFIDSPGS